MRLTDQISAKYREFVIPYDWKHGGKKLVVSKISLKAKSFNFVWYEP